MELANFFKKINFSKKTLTYTENKRGLCNRTRLKNVLLRAASN